MLGLVSNANGGTLQISYFQEGTFCNGHTKISARSNCAGRQSILDLLVDCPLVQTHLNISKLGRDKKIMTCPWRDLPSVNYLTPFKKTTCVIGHFTRRSQQHANLPECKTSRTLLAALGCIQNTNPLKKVLSSNRLYLDIAMPGNL